MTKGSQSLIFSTALITGCLSFPWISLAQAETFADVYLIQNRLCANKRSEEQQQY